MLEIISFSDTFSILFLKIYEYYSVKKKSRLREIMARDEAVAESSQSS